MMLVYSRASACALVFASLVNIAAVVGVPSVPGQFAENTCPQAEWLPQSNAGLPGGQIRCCKGDYTDPDQKYGSCQTSSCRENFGEKNRNCFNYGSSQHPLTIPADELEEPAGKQQGGSAICPYLKKDKAICDTSYFTNYNNGINCRNTQADNHCLGYVKCQSAGITDRSPGVGDAWNSRSDGTDFANGGVAGAGGACSDPAWQGALCFYDGTSENWKVCKGSGDFPCPTGDFPCDGSAFGDPHVVTWGGEHFEYMGECDLVFVDAPKFANGLGFTAHIRTKAINDWSYIEAASIKIGDDILEVGSFGENFLNGVEGVENITDFTLSGFPIDYVMISKKEHHFLVDLGNSGVLTLKSYKRFVSVKFDSVSSDDFDDSVGLMGEYGTGKRFGRDGKTIIQDVNEFGQEWQVLPTEPQLFNIPPPEGKCWVPDAAAQKERRRLGEGISVREAELACAQYPEGAGFEECVHDVIATGDLDAAGAGAF